jgi:hypothetical protein
MPSLPLPSAADTFDPYFLSFGDYKSLITLTKVQDLVQKDETARLSCERDAEQWLRERLGTRFDMDRVFEERGERRHPMVLRHQIAVTLYYLFERVVNRAVPPIRKRGFDMAVEWCRAAIEGKIDSGLPLRWVAETQETQAPVSITIGSNQPKRNHYA